MPQDRLECYDEGGPEQVSGARSQASGSRYRGLGEWGLGKNSPKLDERTTNVHENKGAL